MNVSKLHVLAMSYNKHTKRAKMPIRGFSVVKNKENMNYDCVFGIVIGKISGLLMRAREVALLFS